MSGFSIRNPFLIIVFCLILAIVGTVTLVRMPVDLFPPIHIPVVVVATFYSGMPPEQIETDITGVFERFFTLAGGIDHIESRSLPGVSLIKIYFQPGMDPDAAVSTISNLAMADLRRMPPGTLPPVILKFDASSLPVCLISLKGEGLNETQLRDLGQYEVRNQIANVPGASVPQPFGGRFRQIMVYVDPLKLQAHQLSVMDVVRSINENNLILPSGDVHIGNTDYNLYTNSQIPTTKEINLVPLKTVNGASVLVADVGHAEDAQQIQLNAVRIDGQSSVYLPIMKQGGDTNTLSVVDGVKVAIAGLTGVPKSLNATVVFDQSVFVKTAIDTLLHEGAIGLLLTGVMVLLFLGSVRATAAVFLSIPLSALAAFLAIGAGGGTINAMMLGGLALAFSRLIDNSVIVLENIFRHLELGEAPEIAAERGGKEVALAVLAATLTTAIVFFPVVFLNGVSRFLFVALAAAVVLSLFASYFVAMTVVPLYCARLIKKHEADEELQGESTSWLGRIVEGFNHYFFKLVAGYESTLEKALHRSVTVVVGLVGVSMLCLGLYPVLGISFFPRTDPGQFVINLKAPPGTPLEVTNAYVTLVEEKIRQIVLPGDLKIIVSNIGVTPDYSAIYTSNSGQHMAFVQVGLIEGHQIGSYEYINRVRDRLRSDMPEISTYFQSGGLVDAVLNLGLPAPIDVQVSGANLEKAYATALDLADKIRHVHGVSDLLIPQDMNYPALRLDVDRQRAALIGLSQKEVVNNVITALVSNGMIAPSYWVDPRNGNEYMLTVQYRENAVKSLEDLKQIPLRAANGANSTPLDSVVSITPMPSPTEVDHYALRREFDLYISTAGEDLGSTTHQIEGIVGNMHLPEGIRVDIRGSVQGMRASFKSFGLGLILSVVLVYLVLVAQFASWKDPFVILFAIPPGLAGVLLLLISTGTTLNVMSLMGLVMMVGIVVSNSILIVEFARHLRSTGIMTKEAVSIASGLRLRPVLMTSLATLLGLLPMALKIGTGSEAYAPLARAIIGGLLVSVVVTIYLVPSAYLLIHRKEDALSQEAKA